jgi:hypothetical protein
LTLEREHALLWSGFQNVGLNHRGWRNVFANQSSSGTGIGKRLPRRPRLRRPGLQGRFQLALAGLLLVFCVFAALLVYRYEFRMLEGESFRQTELVMVAVSSARKYVQEILRPRIREVLGQEEFIVEAMSTSFVSRQVMEFFRDEACRNFSTGG